MSSHENAMLYTATVKDAGGSRKTVLREAETVQEVCSLLRREGLLALDVVVSEDRGKLPPAWHPAWLLPMTGLDVELGLRQLASMLRSGVTLLDSLQTVGDQGRGARARRTWQRVRDGVLSGESLADSLAAQRRRFDELVVRLVRVGEQSGELDRAVTSAAEQLEAGRHLRALVVNALVYPALAVLMALGVSAFLVTSVIPKIASFLQASGAELPQTTQMLVDVSDWTLRNGVALILSLAGAVACWLALRAAKWGREAEDVLLLRIPVSGKILRLSATAIFARGMQTMLASGVSLLDALEVAAKLLKNRRFRVRIVAARDAVMRGASLATALGAAPEFLPMLGRMAAVGEVTGALAESFGETARFHETLLGVAIKRFSVLIEPVMIVVTGLIVGFVYIAFFMAIFALAGGG